MAHSEPALHPRDFYLSRLVSFQDTDLVKVVTGIRRSGKSSLLKLMQRHLLEEGKDPRQIVSINFEQLGFGSMSVRDFHHYVTARVLPDKRMYFFFDELQHVDHWEDVVNSLRVEYDCDIYITGSNAFLLSSEYATYLAGRYVEIRLYPLSFQEYLDFHGNGQASLPDAFGEYLRYGGMPGLAVMRLSEDSAMLLWDSIFSTVVMRDILDRERSRGERRVSDPLLLRRIVRFLAGNVGSQTSLRTISNVLANEKVVEIPPRNRRAGVQTVGSYVRALEESYLFHEARRYDLKGKEELRTLGKYYIADLGLRNYILGFHKGDVGRLLENVVYYELLRRGYQVMVGKVGSSEVNFIASRYGERSYWQVTEEMTGEETRKRELAPLRAIEDDGRKTVLVLHAKETGLMDGIRVMPLLDFLLDC